MLTVVEGRLMNSREVGNAVATLLMKGMALDQICDIEGMPTPTQIAYMRRNDVAFAEAMSVAFEGAGIEAGLVLLKGARTGEVGKNQVDAAKWVAERMAPELFQERKTITQEERGLTDEELMFQLQAAARTDDRVKKLLETRDGQMDIVGKKGVLKRLLSRRREPRGKGRHINDRGIVDRPIIDITPQETE